MTIIEHDRITVNAGDDVEIPVGVVYLPVHGHGCGHPYEVKPDDVFTFTLYRHKIELADVVYKCESEAGDNHIKIPKSVTEWWRPGRYYAAIGIKTESVEARIWPYEKPDPFGKIRKRWNFVVNGGESMKREEEREEESDEQLLS